MSDALIELRNIGPKTVEWLERAGINSAQRLRELGAIQAYMALVDAGHGDNLNALWALEGAIQGIDFVDIARNERDRLLAELAAIREWHDISDAPI